MSCKGFFPGNSASGPVEVGNCMSAHPDQNSLIAFTGDFRLRCKPDALLSGEVQIAPELLAVLGECSHVVVNVEGPLTESTPVVRRGIVLQSSPGAAQVLNALHCTVLNLGNNHLFDHGLPGYRDTLELARRHGWLCFGAGEKLEEAAAPLVLSLPSGEVGMLSVCDRWNDKMATNTRPGVYCHTALREVKSKIDSLRTNCRWVGINYHGGEELFRLPMPSRRRRLLGYLGAGADFVIAHHAHVVQGYELDSGRIVYYGLGDFFFDVDHFRGIPEVDESVIPILGFSPSGRIDHRRIFTRFNRQTKQLVVVPDNEWGYEIQADRYRRDYRRYARARFRDWMTVEIHPDFSAFRKLRRFIGVLLNMKDPYIRPVLLAAFQSYLSLLASWRNAKS